MGEQRHVIKRQIIEITLADKEAAWPVQQTLSRLFQQQFPDILDHYLSEFSPADCLHRIDRLELDLGELDSYQLEAQILERIDATLSQVLQEHIGNAQLEPLAKEQDEKIHAQLQLFEQFVREGYLPWWADSTQKHAPEKSLAALLKGNSKVLAQLLIRLIKEPRSLHRLISYFDDSHLIAMMALLTAAPKDQTTSLLQTLLAVEAPLQQFTALPDLRIKFTLWQSLLQVAAAGEPIISRHVEFLMAVTVRWARLQGLAHKVLIGCLQEIAASAAAGNNRWLQVISGLSTPLSRVSAMPDEAHKKPGSTQPESRPKLLAEARVISSNPPLINTNIPEELAGIKSTDNKPAFSETDEVYINNAGLCILWPYLESFFERLELVQNGRFNNQPAQQCAVSLLHYLAAGELDPPEYFLPFNKLLCAMAIDEVYDLAIPLTAAQIEACDALLTAVIANAPILNNMSHNGFRGSFLLRQGVLTAGAGSWLLRVERETYDLVLDRFPWTWQWFKLPWMEYPVRVEW